MDNLTNSKAKELLNTINDFYNTATASEYIEVQNQLLNYLHDHPQFANNDFIRNIIFIVGKQNYFIAKIQEQFNTLKN